MNRSHKGSPPPPPPFFLTLTETQVGVATPTGWRWGGSGKWEAFCNIFAKKRVKIGGSPTKVQMTANTHHANNRFRIKLPHAVCYFPCLFLMNSWLLRTFLNLSKENLERATHTKKKTGWVFKWKWITVNRTLDKKMGKKVFFLNMY